MFFVHTEHYTVFRHITKLLSATISAVMPACPSLYMEQLVPTG